LALLDGLTVLYLEDDADTREIMVVGLERHGARVLSTDSAQAALLMFEQDRPDVVIADLELPELDGWSFIQAIRELPSERDKRTPAIAVTVHNESPDKMKSLSAGFTLHMAKPLTPDQLAARVALLVRRFEAMPPA
jgi:DNA-binding response OmpR family regulator